MKWLENKIVKCLIWILVSSFIFGISLDIGIETWCLFIPAIVNFIMSIIGIFIVLIAKMVED